MLATDALVVDVLEAQIRTLMAYRAAMPRTWMYRGRRADLAAEIDKLLERHNMLTLGR